MAEPIRSRVEKMIRALLGTTHLSGIYGEKHKLAEEAIDNLYAILGDILKEKDEITIGIIGDEIAFEKEPL